ncbi:hypothetical protein C8R44DRAFT_728156 [Mycena epipterygia]|nr:hypothetical protein C8R44DRAFT_728156 [Mycena epipterygia]
MFKSDQAALHGLGLGLGRAPAPSASKENGAIKREQTPVSASKKKKRKEKRRPCRRQSSTHAVNQYSTSRLTVTRRVIPSTLTRGDTLDSVMHEAPSAPKLIMRGAIIPTFRPCNHAVQAGRDLKKNSAIARVIGIEVLFSISAFLLTKILRDNCNAAHWDYSEIMRATG